MKRSLLSFSISIVVAFCLVVATARPAWGYVDPGSGFLAVQTIASVAAAFGYFLRRRIRSFFSSDRKDKSDLLPATLPKSEQRPAD